MKRKPCYISLSTTAGRRLPVPEAATWSIRSAVMLVLGVTTVGVATDELISGIGGAIGPDFVFIGKRKAVLAVEVPGVARKVAAGAVALQVEGLSCGLVLEAVDKAQGAVNIAGSWRGFVNPELPESDLGSPQNTEKIVR
jgi:hypothetical protein